PIDAPVSAAYYSLVIAEDLACPVIAEVRVPGRSHTWAERTVKRIVRIFRRVAGISEQRKTHFGVIDLPLQSRAPASADVGLYVQRLIAGVDEFNLFSVSLRRRHLQRPTQSIGQREGRLHVPTIAEVHIVVRNAALV